MHYLLKICIVIAIFFRLNLYLSASNLPITYEDSLVSLLESKDEKIQVDALIALYDFNYNKDFTKSKSYLLKALIKSQKLIDDEKLASILNKYATVLTHEGNLEQALATYQKAKKIYVKLNKIDKIAAIEYNIGDLYQNKSEYDKALKHLFIALQLDEKTNNDLGIAYDYNTIGSNYYMMDNFDMALKYYKTAQMYFQKVNDKDGIARTLHNIGNCYSAQNKIEDAILLYNQSLKLHNELGNKANVFDCYNSLGTSYAQKDNLDKAKEYFTLYYNGAKEFEDYREMSIALLNLAQVSFDLKDNKMAIHYAYQGIHLATVYPNIKEQLYKFSSTIYESLGKQDSALFHFKEYVKIHDSIYNAQNSQALLELQTKFDSEKKDKELLKKDAQIKTNKLNALQQESAHRLTRIYFIIGISFLAAFILFVLYRYRQKQKTNIKLEEKNKIILNQKIEVEKQKEIIEEKASELAARHKEITDSINYAERLQRSLMASKSILAENLNDFFILFNPKEKVSGDFYWCTKTTDNKFLLACADSTGHGVPGAIMSMMNMNSLKEAVKEGLTLPADILNYTRKTIIATLANDGSIEGGKDGMDCALIAFDFDKNIIHFALANNPLWIFRDNKCIVFNPDKMPVGKHDQQNIPFTSQYLELQKNDLLIMFTDGYADQFGGPKGKKFKYNSLQDLLLKSCNNNMQNIHETLNHEFNLWIGNLEQIDDVCIVGIRI